MFPETLLCAGLIFFQRRRFHCGCNASLARRNVIWSSAAGERDAAAGTHVKFLPRPRYHLTADCARDNRQHPLLYIFYARHY